MLKPCDLLGRAGPTDSPKLPDVRCTPSPQSKPMPLALGQPAVTPVFHPGLDRSYWKNYEGTCFPSLEASHFHSDTWAAQALCTCLLPQNEPEHATALDGGRGKVCTHPSELPAVWDPLSSSFYTAQNISLTQPHLPPSKHPKGAACSHVGRITPYKLIPLILSPSHPSEDYTFRESHRNPWNHHHQSKKRSPSKS